MKKRIWLFLALFIGFVSVGCRYVGEDPIFEVRESGLNWLDIYYFNYRRQPATRVKVHMDGTGFVKVRSGTSMLVSNSFAADTRAESWEDVQEERFKLDPEQINQLFQMLVDNGLFKKRYKWNNSVHSNDAIFAHANINNKTTGSQDDIYTTDPELAEHLKSAVFMFYHPRPRRKRAAK